MIPEFIQNLGIDELVTFVPPVALVIVGCYFLYRVRKERMRGDASMAKETGKVAGKRIGEIGPKDEFGFYIGGMKDSEYTGNVAEGFERGHIIGSAEGSTIADNKSFGVAAGKKQGRSETPIARDTDKPKLIENRAPSADGGTPIKPSDRQSRKQT